MKVGNNFSYGYFFTWQNKNFPTLCQLLPLPLYLTFFKNICRMKNPEN